MDSIELQFEIASIDEAAIDWLMDEYDAVVSIEGPTTLVALMVEGESVVDAAIRIASELRHAGFTVLRLYEDLVTRGVIATRTGVTTQAVGLWVRGERKSGFPPPFNTVAGGVFLWTEVNAWLVANHLGGERVQLPTRSDHAQVNCWLATGRMTVTSWPTVATVGFKTGAYHAATRSHVAVDAKTTDFSLAS